MSGLDYLKEKLVLLDVFKFLLFLSLKLRCLYCCGGSAVEQTVEAILEDVIKLSSKYKTERTLF